MRSRLRYYTLALVMIWSAVLGGSLVLHINEIHQETKSFAYSQALTHFNKDQAFRFWSTRHGGVYVPASKQTPPNPYLSKSLERDIQTPSGKRLTLMNPAYMLRQINEWFSELYKLEGHITSLTPLRPENGPDDWEREALVAFTRGHEEVSQYSIIDGEPYLRFMRPMFVQPGCLQCHGHQGYKEGDVRGGVSVSVPMTSLLEIQGQKSAKFLWTYALFWAIGLAGIGLGWHQIKKSDDDRNQAVVALRRAHDDLENRVSKRTEELEKVNDNLKREIGERERVEEALRKARNKLEERMEKRTSELSAVSLTLETEIGERERAQETARKTHERFQELWNNAPVAYHTLDASGIITSVNNTEAEMLGYTKAEMLGKPIFQFIIQEQQKEAEGRFAEKLAGKQVPRHENRIYTKKNGSRMYVSIDDVLEYDGEGNVTGVRTTMVDVTDRKRAEDALQESEDQLRRLSSQLLKVQEEERKRIARELHDSTGQSLAAIKFVAEDALSQIDKHDKTTGKESLKTLIPLVQQAAQEVRRIHTDLRPSLLDDLGITSTISWFCREFENVYKGISTEKRIDIEENNIPEPLKIVIFRILQEAMNNVAKYGKADLIRISLAEKENAVEIVIEDNGQGFDVQQTRNQKGPQGGFGLTSMKERAELAGGTLSVKSNPGAGTAIRASWPLEQ